MKQQAALKVICNQNPSKSLALGLCFALMVGGMALVTSAQPINDSFSNRSAIPGNNVTVLGSLAGATSEANEPVIPGVSSGQTAWWTWTAPSNGIVTLSVNATNFSSLLTVYTGNNLASLSLVASNNYLACYEHSECGCHWRERTQTTFHVARGQAYRICVDSAIITDASMEIQSIPINGGYLMQWDRPLRLTF